MTAKSSHHQIHFKLYRGKCSEDVPVLAKAVEFFISELLYARKKKYNLNVEITFKPNAIISGHDLCDGITFSKYSKGIEWYVIQLNNDVPFLELLSTLAHEVVHVIQFATGRLKNDTLTWKWQNVDYGEDPYTGDEDVDCKLPWEYDAYCKEIDLVRKFVKQYYSNW